MHGLHETKVPGLIGQAADESLVQFGIFRSDGANGDVHPIRELPVADQMSGIGGDGHVRVAIRTRLPEFDDYPCVDRQCAGLIQNERVDIHLLKPGEFANHLGHAQEHVLKRFQVSRGHLAKRAEQPCNIRFSYQFSCQEFIQRRQGDSRRTLDLDLRAAGTKRYHGAEYGIAGYAYHQFAAVGLENHWLDGNAVHMRRGAFFPHRSPECPDRPRELHAHSSG